MIGIIQCGALNNFYVVPLPRGFDVHSNVGHHYGFISNCFNDPNKIRWNVLLNDTMVSTVILQADHPIPLKMSTYFQLSNLLLRSKKFYDKRTDKLKNKY